VTVPAAHFASASLSLATKGTRRLALGARLLAYRLLSIFGHRNYVRFVVITRSRTGSNLLLSFLNRHPDIFCEGEVFARMRGKDPLARLNTVFGKQPRHILAKGFKIFYYHPLDADGDALWSTLSRMQDLRVIHLKRANILRTLMSRKIAGLQDTWTATRYDSVGVSTRRVEMAKQELEDGFRQTRMWESEADARFGKQRMLTVTYEELVGNPQGSYDRMLAFLGMRTQVPRTGLRRQNPENLRDLLQNYDDLKQSFAGTAWQTFFDD
jgi:hypothetical protein